ncbi:MULTISPECIES: methylated-DNA--[protein]-cysteine S-methyltransferase [unclassified Marinitoga]|uniref:methylated-DNA--[protein]-cysteine S-methyltransferase n=1 Tax=unclassified Marinitoga TaxID=2640159 RepID=UPI00065A2643|nr:MULTISPECIES: methylated-DNA--[protein]-cysteine S-methyltransferase [unclassified Marinitoga]KLO23364.1 hypothetical protein X274_06525 [Marinitoga sp. 1155]
MNKFVINVNYSSIIGFVKNNRIFKIEFSAAAKEYYDAYTKDFYYKIKEYLSGKDVLNEIPYEIHYKSDFEKDVLTALKKVKFGNVVSYKELAIMSGHPYASRAVGSIMAKNVLPLIFPCHRVIKNKGILGNYGGKSELKKYFLRLEGLIIENDRIISYNKL